MLARELMQALSECDPDAVVISVGTMPHLIPSTPLKLQTVESVCLHGQPCSQVILLSHHLDGSPHNTELGC